MTTSLPLFTLLPSHQQSLNRKIRGVLLCLVLVLHVCIAQWLINATHSPRKAPPKVIEVAMLALPEKPKIPPPPAPPVVKKEPVKPVVKPPQPVKKITLPKRVQPVATPKLLTSASENAPTSAPQVEAPPAPTPPAPVMAKAPEKPTETVAQSHGDSISGGECDNCQSIERRLKRKNDRWRFEGAVTFVLSIDENGQIQDANVKNTQPEGVFDEQSLAEIKEIVMEMAFTPKIVNDHPVAFKGTKIVKFQIQK